jgi:hypothetical protein
VSGKLTTVSIFARVEAFQQNRFSTTIRTCSTVVTGVVDVRERERERESVLIANAQRDNNKDNKKKEQEKKNISRPIHTAGGLDINVYRLAWRGAAHCSH